MYAIHGISNITGERKLLAPEVYLRVEDYGIWFLKSTHKFLDSKTPITDKLEAVKQAKEFFATNEYQDVFVLESRGCDIEGNPYCPHVVWKNGRFTNYFVRTDVWGSIYY